MVCGICKESGHNKRTCPNKLAAEGDSKVPNNKERKKVIDTSNSSVRSYSTASVAVQNIRETSSFTNEIENDLLDLKEILSKRQTIKHKEIISSTQRKPTESVNHDEKETVSERSEKVGETENNPSKPSTKLKSKKSSITWLNPGALKRLNSGPSKEDGPGYIYMYKISNPTTEERECYKIGLSKDLPARRIHVQETSNKQKYEPVTTHETPYRYLTETVIHLQLKSQRTPRSYGDGKTEWFTGNKDEFKDIIVKVIREVKALYVD